MAAVAAIVAFSIKVVVILRRKYGESSKNKENDNMTVYSDDRLSVIHLPPVVYDTSLDTRFRHANYDFNAEIPRIPKMPRMRIDRRATDALMRPMYRGTTAI